MQTRHRIPQVFNLSMVDVLCCALGSIILLWLLNSRDAKDRAREAGSTKAMLNRSEAELADERKASRDLQTRLARLTRAQADLLKQLASLQDANRKEAEDLRKKTLQLRDLETALAALKKLSAETAASLTRRTAEKVKLEELLAALKAKNLKDALALAKLTREQTDLLKELAALKALRVEDREVLQKKTADLAAVLKELALLKKVSLDDKDLLAKKSLELKDLAKALAALRLLKTDVDKRLRASEDQILVLRKDLGDRKKAMADAEARLLRDLEGARASIAELQRDKKSLTGQIMRVREEADKRFAGIALTGKRVIFLVDMSGSMELVDEKTAAPAKWSGVRDTLAKIMQSLPDLEKFQIIVFSDKVSFLLGNADDWIPFDPRASVSRAVKALAAVKPTGGTNMYAAIEAAFRFRRADLDTIYFLSDGLPNLGEGATEEQAARLKETELGELLGKHIRNKLKTDWNRPQRGKQVRINTVGFFYESPDVGAFLWALARENDGSFVGMSKP
jgi:hypothetical protein